MEHDSDGNTNCNWCTRLTHQKIGKGTGGIGYKSTSGGHPKYSIGEIGQNTEKSPGETCGDLSFRHPIPARRPDFVIINKKKKKKKRQKLSSQGLQSGNQRKMNKYLDLARKLNTLWDMRVTMILIVVGVLGTVPKDLERGLKE